MGYPLQYSCTSLVAHMVKNLPAMRETWVWSLGWEDPLEEVIATRSSILAWRIPMDRGAWQATVHETTKSWTWLSDWVQHSTFKLHHVLSSDIYTHPWHDVCVYIACTWYIYIMCMIFSLYAFCLFILFNSVFIRVGFLTLIMFHTSDWFSFMDCSFGVICKTTFPNSRSWWSPYKVFF